MPGKRRFIDKKKAVTYRLVPRCQLDPDGDASEHVMVPVNPSEHEKFNIKLPEFVLPPSAKEISQVKKQIPVKGPQPNWDPDIVAALDDDFNYEDSANVLEDDFITVANGPAVPSHDDSESGSEDCDSEFLFSDDENQSIHGSDDGKSKFTQCSLASAVTNCTEEFRTFNERFEKFYEKNYSDDQIGALDHEEIVGGSFIPTDELLETFQEDLDRCNKKKLYPYGNRDLDENLKNKILHYADANDEEKPVKIVVEQPLKYDCESIRSIYSNKCRQLTVIEVDKKEDIIKISSKPWKQKLTKSCLRQLDKEAIIKEEDQESQMLENKSIITSLYNFRPKNETAEERRERKQAVKQERREKRIIKKENKVAFKVEKKRTDTMVNANKSRTIHLL